MPKAVRKKRKAKEDIVVIPHTQTSTSSQRWRILPPEIIHIILGLLKDDIATLRACSLAARDFSQHALSRIGRHITLNHVPRIKLCVQMLTANSAFKHVRSLDLGVVKKSSNPEDYLEEQLAILEIFAQRQTLTRLWLSRFPFHSTESMKMVKIRDIVTAFGSTVSDLGLYECKFTSYTDMISLVRAFPHCGSLYIRDCITDDESTSGNVFSELPEHKLSLDVLELSCASSNGSTVDVSSLIEDACLDVSRLSALTCHVISAGQARSVANSTSASPIQHFQLACTEPGGFQAFFGPIAEKWSLNSLTIGPLTDRTDRVFWQDALRNFRTVPDLKELTIIYYSPVARTFDSCWAYFNGFLCRKDLFPQLAQVDIQATLHWTYGQRYRLGRELAALRKCRTVTLWGFRCWG